MKSEKRKIVYISIILLMLIILFILIQNIGYIKDYETLTPTGNIDIFEINCTCYCDSDEQEAVPNTGVFKSNNGTLEPDKGTSESGEKVPEPDERMPDLGDLIVYDDDKIWDNQDLRIFINPVYDNRNIIAPGSFNSYAFIIKNNNDFDITVDIAFSEVNYKNINMQYKLKNDGKYLLGSENSYEKIKGRKIEDIWIPKEGQKQYTLDWKWVDSNNDAEVGFDVNSFYKLSIIIMAN